MTHQRHLLHSEVPQRNARMGPAARGLVNGVWTGSARLCFFQDFVPNYCGSASLPPCRQHPSSPPADYSKSHKWSNNIFCKKAKYWNEIVSKQILRMLFLPVCLYLQLCNELLKLSQICEEFKKWELLPSADEQEEALYFYPLCWASLQI